jgi:DNA-directed RNA polymerase subunit RPC12/RpoP
MPHDSVQLCPHCGSSDTKWFIATKLRVFYLCLKCDRIFSVLATSA